MNKLDSLVDAFLQGFARGVGYGFVIFVGYHLGIFEGILDLLKRYLCN